MPNFYLGKKISHEGTYEVHNGKCIFLPRANEESIFLGEFSHCSDAVYEARKYYVNANGCFFCSHECHIKDVTSKYYESNATVS